MESCLVSGSHGFIGSHLVTALQQRGFAVNTIDHNLFRNFVSLSQYKPQQYDYIFHLSAYGNMASQTDPVKCYEANVNDLQNFLEITKQINYRVFVNFSTSSVLLPIQTPYSITKKLGEELCDTFSEIYQKRIISVRPSSIFGEGEADFRFIPTVCRSLVTGEEFSLSEGTHDWLYVKDFVDCLVNQVIFNLEALPSTRLNLSSGTQVLNSQIVEMLEAIAHKKAKYQNVEKLRSWDSSQWEVEPSFQFNKTFMEKALKNTYEYYFARYAPKND